MAFRHRDRRRGRLIETAEFFQGEGEASKERKQAKGSAPRPKQLCPCAKFLPWWSHRQNTCPGYLHYPCLSEAYNVNGENFFPLPRCQ
jgi:hypothetical protein